MVIIKRLFCLFRIFLSFQKQRIHSYVVEYMGFNPDTNMVELGGLDIFADIVSTKTKITFYKLRLHFTT